MSNINEYILKITGGVCLGKELDASLVVKINEGELSIYEVSKRDNDDGTYDLVYKARFTSGIGLVQGGKAIRGRDRTSESKKTRYAIKCFFQEQGEIDTEEAYKTFQQKLRSNIHEVWDLLKSK
jgi:hypothetical protein